MQNANLFTRMQKNFDMLKQAFRVENQVRVEEMINAPRGVGDKFSALEQVQIPKEVVKGSSFLE